MLSSACLRIVLHMCMWCQGGGFTGSVTDRGAGECMDPEGNRGNPGEGNEGGPGPPSEMQDKQLISSSGGGKTPIGQPARQEDESGATSRTHHAQST
jgi:hypothetical protein